VGGTGFGAFIERAWRVPKFLLAVIVVGVAVMIAAFAIAAFWL